MLNKTFKDKIKCCRNLKDDTIKYIFNSKIINRLFLEVCSDCQYNCPYCCNSHEKLIYKNYHLSIDELKNFLYYTKKSRYFIKEIFIQGMGEPTLWNNLNDGIKILHNSVVVGSIFIITNGVSINNIEEKTFEYINNIRISMYPDSKKNDYVTFLYKKIPEKISFKHVSKFHEPPYKKYHNSVPCTCICPFPRLIKDKIFYCNAFKAAELKGVDIFSCHEVYSELKENYLDRIEHGNHDLCQYCSGNKNIAKYLKMHNHRIK